MFAFLGDSTLSLRSELGAFILADGAGTTNFCCESIVASIRIRRPDAAVVRCRTYVWQILKLSFKW